jgi:flagellar hook-length control protein FliK
VKPSHAANTTQSGTASVTSGESLRGLETNSPGVHNPGKPAAPFFDPLTPQISEKIQFLVRDGGGVLRIRLQPDEFGEMEIQAETTSKGLVARIAAESAHVKNYLESSLHALQQHLQDQGMKVDRIQVTLQDGSDFQGSSNHSSKSGHSNSGQNGPHRSLNVFRNTGQSAAADSTDTQFYYPEKRFHTVA